jgi:quercetin dioxygenase-like cupin family protein
MWTKQQAKEDVIMTYSLDHRSGNHLDLLGDRYRLLATGDQTDGSIAVVEVTVSPGGGVPPHVDNNEAIGWYVLDGSLVFMVEGEEQTLAAGGWIYSPRGVLHTFRNASDRPARALLLALPAGLDGFFREAGRSIDPEDDTRLPTDDEISAAMAAAPRYGLDFPAPAA